MSRSAMAILWPSFLMAVVLEGLVFSSLDPGEFHFGQLTTDVSPQAIYTLAFFVFWGIISTSGAISALLWIEMDRPPGEPPAT